MIQDYLGFLQIKNEITQINKGIFTSCKNQKDKCPPWSMKAEK